MSYTYWALGDYQRAMLTDLEEIQTIRHASLWMLGREAEALEGIRMLEQHWTGGSDVAYIRALRTAFERDRGCLGWRG